MTIARAFVFATTAALVVLATDARATHYLVLALIGDQLTIVTAHKHTGNSVDRNQYESFATNSSVFDAAALRAADGAIRKTQPQATVTMMLAKEPALYALKDQWLAADAVDPIALIAQLKGKLGADPDTHIIVVLPYRAEPQLATLQGHIGTGKVTGLGFYVNNFQKTCKGWGSAECDPGFLAPFANFRMVMVDTNGALVESEEFAAVGSMRTAAAASDLKAWHALSDAQKANLLQSLLQREIARLVPDLLAKRHAAQVQH